MSRPRLPGASGLSPLDRRPQWLAPRSRRESQRRDRPATPHRRGDPPRARRTARTRARDAGVVVAGTPHRGQETRGRHALAQARAVPARRLVQGPRRHVGDAAAVARTAGARRDRRQRRQPRDGGRPRRAEAEPDSPVGDAAAAVLAEPGAPEVAKEQTAKRIARAPRSRKPKAVSE